MAILSNHYERAFQQYIRAQRIACIAVDESQRNWDNNQSLKSLDFIVTPPGGQTILIDVKGRKKAQGVAALDNWATQDDIDSLTRWQEAFGRDTVALLVFTYELNSETERFYFDDTVTTRDKHYAFLAISLVDYQRHLRIRSPKWNTVHIPRPVFRDWARPISFWLSKG